MLRCWGAEMLTHVLNQNGATCGFEMCFAIGCRFDLEYVLDWCHSGGAQDHVHMSPHVDPSCPPVMHVWEWEDDSGWNAYAAALSSRLEAAFIQVVARGAVSTIVTEDIGSVTYTFDVSGGVSLQTNTLTGFARKMRRRRCEAVPVRQACVIGAWYGAGASDLCSPPDRRDHRATPLSTLTFLLP